MASLGHRATACLATVLLLCATKLVAGTLSGEANLLGAIQTRARLSTLTFILNNYPHLMQKFSDSSMNGTILLPLDPAFDAAGFSLAEIFELNDRTNPTKGRTTGAPFSRWMVWQLILNHMLEGDRAYRYLDITQRAAWNTSLPGGMIGVLNKTEPGSNKTAYTLVSGSNVTKEYTMATMVARNIYSAEDTYGLVMHTVDGLLVPSYNLNFNATTVMEAVKGTLFGQIATIAASTGAYAYLNATGAGKPMTVFVPSDLAIRKWLNTTKMTMQMLQANATICSKLVDAHMATSGYTSPSAMFLNDLLDANVVPSSGVTFMDGKPARAANTWWGPSPRNFTISNGMKNATLENYKYFGGTPVGPVEGTPVHVLHGIDSVLY